jgi:DNA repair protein RadC
MQTGTMKLRELTIKYAVRKSSDGQPVMIGNCLAAPRDAAAAFMSVLQDEPVEVFAMICVNTKHRAIAYHEVSRGTLDAALVHPREVFQAAILSHASAIVVAHCHPSGDSSPSPQDEVLTARLAAAGMLLGIELLDHIIVGDGQYFSFKEAGRI